MSNGGDSGGPVRRVRTRSGAELPALGLGTYGMGEDRATRAVEVAALRLGLDLGMDLIDTAETYADGGAEEVTGEAVKGRRDEVFIVSKVQAENASRRGTIEAAERSLRRLGTDRIDLYLLHWPGEHPLQDTLDAFAQLVDEQKIVHYGVSNFDAAAMQACESLRGGPGVVANQVFYNLVRRSIEPELLPCVRRARGRCDGLFAARRGARLAGRRVGRGRRAPRRQRGMRRTCVDAAPPLGCIDSQGGGPGPLTHQPRGDVAGAVGCGPGRPRRGFPAARRPGAARLGVVTRSRPAAVARVSK